MKKLAIILLVIVALVAFIQPVSAAKPYGSPPETYDISPGTTLDFPEVNMSINIGSITGTYTPHIGHPAGKTDAEESWIQLTGGGTAYISLIEPPTLFGSLVVPDGTTAKITVHIQPHQSPMITIQSSQPITLIYGVPATSLEFTTAQIRMVTEVPYVQIVHAN